MNDRTTGARPETGDTETGDTEAQLAETRKALAAEREALAERLKPATLAKDAVWMLGRAALPVARVAGRGALKGATGATRRNPFAAAMIGAGLVWLVLGGSRAAEPAKRERQKAGGGGAVPRPSGAGAVHSARANEPEAADADLAATDSGWMAGAEEIRARGAALIAKLDRLAREGAHDATELAALRAEVLAAQTRDIRDHLAEGLEDLASDARERALAAREAAYEAQLSAMTRAKALVTEHPVAVTGAVTGLLAAAGSVLFWLMARDDGSDADVQSKGAAEGSER